MEIRNVNNTSFQAKNKTIRFADDIARHVNICYPRASSSRVDDFVNIQCFRKLKSKLNETTEFMREDISDAFGETENVVGRLLSFIKPIKKYRIGNCGESAQLSSIVAKINGIKNCYIASLKTSCGKNLDHSVLFVNDEKPYIIDSWLGFADFVQNTITRYKSEYRHHYNFEDEDKLVFEKLENDYTEFLNQDFKKTHINKIKRIYPQLLKKRGYVE